MGEKVTIYTQVYNTKQYLDQCIRSVLNQTYTNFEYIIVDNGCTDGSSEVIRQYANLDKRIIRVPLKENQYGPRIRLTEEIATGEYYTVLDSDDWWELDYLEKLVVFLEINDLDLAVTGTVAYIEKHAASVDMRKVDTPVILTQRKFAQYYPQYWAYPSTSWGSLMKRKIFLKTDNNSVFEQKYPYGGDTMVMLKYIENCNKVGIHNSALYHYRLHRSGKTYRYNPRRFEANVAFYEQAKDFLESHHTFDTPKQEWLQRVYLTSMLATLQLLRDAKVPADEKAAECARIAAHPLTAAVLTNACGEREQWYALISEIVFQALSSGTVTDAESLHTVLKLLSPHCCGAVLTGSLGLFSRETSLREALRKDDWAQLTHLLLNLIWQKRYTKQYDLGQILCDLIPDGSVLYGTADTRFFREYAESCMLILEENYAGALDQMTGLLLEQKKLYDGERFLDVYLTLAALENQVPAFVFGKLQLAKLYLRQNRREECRAVIAELVEMGVDNEELSALRQELEGTP